MARLQGTFIGVLLFSALLVDVSLSVPNPSVFTDDGDFTFNVYSGRTIAIQQVDATQHLFGSAVPIATSADMASLQAEITLLRSQFESASAAYAISSNQVFSSLTTTFNQLQANFDQLDAAVSSSTLFSDGDAFMDTFDALNGLVVSEVAELNAEILDLSTNLNVLNITTSADLDGARNDLTVVQQSIDHLNKTVSVAAVVGLFSAFSDMTAAVTTINMSVIASVNELTSYYASLESQFSNLNTTSNTINDQISAELVALQGECYQWNLTQLADLPIEASLLGSLFTDFNASVESESHSFTADIVNVNVLLDELNVSFDATASTFLSILATNNNTLDLLASNLSDINASIDIADAALLSSLLGALSETTDHTDLIVNVTNNAVNVLSLTITMTFEALFANLSTVNSKLSCTSVPPHAVLAHGSGVSCANTVSGDTCDPICEVGYAVNGTYSCDLGRWTSWADCIPSPCLTPPSIANILPTACVNTASNTTCPTQCKPGYAAAGSALCTLGNWSSVTGTCTVVACPVNSSGTPCTCNSGFSGTLTFQANFSYTGSCSLVPCPALSTGAPSCKCNTGYVPYIIPFSGGVYTTGCTAATCPSFSTGAPTCKCNSGYSPQTALNFSEGVYTQSCSLVPCPAGAGGAPTCTCNSGYASAPAPTFVVSTASWSGTCTLVACPGNASGAPACLCNWGYKGTLTFSSNVWSGSCSLVACPVNSAGQPNCVCNAGYTGPLNFSRTTGAYTTSCTPNPCAAAPTAVVGGNVSQCAGTASGSTCPPKCNSGYVVSSTYSCSLGVWSGAPSCLVVACPTYSSGGPNCFCNSGYLGGYPKFNMTTSTYTTGCTLATCPLNASNAPACVCNPGYTGALTFNLAWYGTCVPANCTTIPALTNGNAASCAFTASYKTCKPVCNSGYVESGLFSCALGNWSGTPTCTLTACPTNAAGAPNCACNFGYSPGVLPWNGTAYTSGCTLVACPANAAGAPACTCNSGYSPGGVLAFSNGAYTGSCSLVACPAGASGAPACTCNSGYSPLGLVTFNRTTATYTSTCTLVTCPANAGGAPACSCNKGYAGTLTFGGTGVYTGSCTLVSCPGNATGGPNCVCNAGYTGVLTFIFANSSSTWSGVCSPNMCATNVTAVANGVTPICAGTPSGSTCKPQCNQGYALSGTYSCSLGNWSGTPVCNLVTCPTGSSGAPNCVCTSGYAGGTLSFNLVTGAYSSFCSLVPCPTYAISAPLCTCSSGYSPGGLLPFSLSSGVYTSNCSLVACPANAYGAPSCTCYSGFASTLAFVSGAYTGSCTLVACPANAAGAPSCACNSGYASTLAFVGNVYTGNCTLVACPAFSSGAPSCTCVAGSTGSLTWSTSSNAYTGSCTENSCTAAPATVANGVVSQCAGTAGSTSCAPICNSGYALTGTYTCSLGAWTGSPSCPIVACPAGASGAPACSCNNGYSGTLSFTGTAWSGTCTLVACPANSAGAPTCTCNSGYAGGVLTFNTTTDTYTSSCTLVACPANSGVAPSCVCNSGYTGTLSFVGSAWTGSCTLAPCPANATGAPTCACISGMNGTLVFTGGAWTGTCGVGKKYRFWYTGAPQTWVVPSGATLMRIKLWGAGGGGQATQYGGGGGYVTGNKSLTAGNTYIVMVGGGGAGNCVGACSGVVSPGGYGGGGGAAEANGGGGGSFLFFGGTAFSNIIAAAGGGGGGGGGATGYYGGAGGGASGQQAPKGAINLGGYGGTASAGGAGCNLNSTIGSTVAGSAMQGGGNVVLNVTYGGGGGGGYYGGGMGNRQGPWDNSGGGGGSGFAAASVTTPTLTAGASNVAGNSADADVVGFAFGGTAGAGGNGIVVLTVF